VLLLETIKHEANTSPESYLKTAHKSLREIAKVLERK